MGKEWIKKQKKEKYYKDAQKEGLRSRAAFKLRSIQAKFKILNDAKLILDLCCAPGSWIQEIKRVLTKASIIGVDITKMKPIEDVTFIQGDITDESIIKQLEAHISQSVDVILSDCAPKLTGMKETDYARHIFLIECILQLVKQFLRVGGHLVCKLFDGPDTLKIRDQLKQTFKEVTLFKPDASRKKSPEMYLIGKSLKKEI